MPRCTAQVRQTSKSQYHRINHPSGPTRSLLTWAGVRPHRSAMEITYWERVSSARVFRSVEAHLGIFSGERRIWVTSNNRDWPSAKWLVGHEEDAMFGW